MDSKECFSRKYSFLCSILKFRRHVENIENGQKIFFEVTAKRLIG